jgi:hypothetical protein
LKSWGCAGRGVLTARGCPEKRLLFSPAQGGKRESISSRQDGTSALRPGDRRLAAPLSPWSPRRRMGRRRRRTLLRERRDGLEILTTVGGRETNSLRRRFTPRDSFLGFVPLPAWGFVPWFLCPLHTSAARRLRKTRDDTAEGGCFLSILWCRWLLFALLFCRRRGSRGAFPGLRSVRSTVIHSAKKTKN